jgi:hypothetical protein
VAITFTSATLKDIESRSSDYTLEFRIPATKRNKSGLDHLDSSNVQDGNNILKRTPCVVKSDGMPIFRGDFKLMGIVDDRGYKEFKCIILGHAQDWAEGMKNKTLQSYDWGTNFTLDEAGVEATWTNDYTDGYVFPLINYGAWKYENNVKAEEFRPAIFMRSLFEKAFKAEGYTLQTDTDANDFFNTANNPIMDTVVIPFTGDGFKIQDAVVDNNTFEAVQGDNTKLYTATNKVEEVLTVYPKSVRLTPYNNVTTIKSGLDRAGSAVRNDKIRRFYLTSAPTTTLDENSFVVIHTAIDQLYLNNIPENSGDINTPKGTVYSIADYGTEYVIDPYNAGTSSVLYEVGTYYYIDVITRDIERDETVTPVHTNKKKEDYFGRETYQMQIVSSVSGDDNPITVRTDSKSGTGASKFDLATYKYTATESIKSRFEFDCKFFADQIYLPEQTLSNKNISDVEFRIIHKVAGVFTRVVGTTRITNTSSVSNINEYSSLFGYELAVEKVDVNSGVIELKSGDEVYVDVLIRFGDKITSANNSVRSTRVGRGFQQRVAVSEAKLVSFPQADVIDSAIFDIGDILDDRYSTFMYIKGCLHAFNLLIQTDVATKTVKIKTRDDFYGDKINAIDWTDKVDTKKQYVIDYLDYYKQFLDFTFKDDSSDGHANAISDIEEKKLGSYRDDIGERFAEGIQKMENPLFAYTYHIADLSVGDDDLTQPVYLSRLWTEYSANSLAPTRSYNFRPRLLFYNYSAQHPDSYFIYMLNKKTVIPAALPCSFGSSTPSLTIDEHLGYNSTANASGLYKNYYEKTANTIEKGTKLTLPVILTNTDIFNFDISKIIYLSYPEEIKGYWIVDSVKNYLPTTTVSTTVELIKLEEFDARIESPNSIVIEETPDVKEWKEEREGYTAHRPSGGVGSGKYKWEEEEQVTTWKDSQIVNEGSRGGTTQKQVSNIKDLGGKGYAPDRGNKAWQTFKRDEQAEEAAAEESRVLDFENDKGKLVAKDSKEGIPEDFRKKAYQKKLGEDNVSASVVQNSKENISVGRANTVMGRGNVVMGDSQTVVGQYAQPNPSSSFSVGTGKSRYDRSTAFSVDKTGIVREGRGGMVEQRDDGGFDQVWEEVNGEIVKVNL